MENKEKDKSQDFNTYQELIETLLDEISRLPGPIRKKIEKELNELLKLIKDKRSPRFALVGRRGAGKSTLINAIYGAPVRPVGSVRSQTGKAIWNTYENNGREIDMLDTRGVQEGTKPNESDEANTAFDSLKDAFEEKMPDVLLFLIKAKEVDSAIEGDLAELKKIHQHISEKYKVELPLVFIVTQVDELDPPFIRVLPTDDDEKNKNIEAATGTIEEHVNNDSYLFKFLAKTLPVASYVRYKNDGTIDTEHDYRYNIESLVELLLSELPTEAKLNFARLAEVKKFQKKIANRIVDLCSISCGAIGAQPIPVADLPIITTIQGFMISAVGYISGKEMTYDTVKEFLVAIGATTGLAFILREGVRALLKFFPGAGNYASGAVAGVFTKSLGTAAVNYYINDESIEDVKAKFKKSAKKH
jgi:uncharacterized protein (DUF697 family)/predicted GTPase